MSRLGADVSTARLQILDSFLLSAQLLLKLTLLVKSMNLMPLGR